jgi:hypothetical protein
MTYRISWGKAVGETAGPVPAQVFNGGTYDWKFTQPVIDDFDVGGGRKQICAESRNLLKVQKYGGHGSDQKVVMP